MIKIINNKDFILQNEDDLSKNEKNIDVSKTVSEIIDNVKTNGDKALVEYCAKFDKANIKNLEVSVQEIEDAFNSVSQEYIDILFEAYSNIHRFHKRQVRNNFIINEKNGVILGQKIIPLRRVGLYVPGGTACYPSTVLMDVIPAKIAKVDEICIVTPPSKDGSVNPVILAAAKIAGVDKIYKVGGAQAIAALAYGTPTIKKVDKIVGPGNAYVAEAKRQVYGMVDIDMIAGPSDILIVADNTCNPKVVAADMLSQAEHDVLATAILVTTDKKFAQKVANEIEIQLPQLPREEIARKSIDNNGKIIITKSINDAIEISNEIAPEHLEICVDNPFDYLDKVKNAGSVFLGKNTPEVLGDYFAGPNHTLPTNGTARFSSPLGVDDFVKKSSFTYYTEDALFEVSHKISYFAGQEGLQAHAKSATVRFSDNVDMQKGEDL